MDKQALDEQRTAIAAGLLTLVQYVDGPKQDQNLMTFSKALYQKPEIGDSIWGDVAFATGVFGRFMYRQPLTADETRTLWTALVWATWYEHYFRPRYVADRVADLCTYLRYQARDRSFAEQAASSLGTLIPILDPASKNTLASCLTSYSDLLETLSLELPVTVPASPSEVLTITPSQPVGSNAPLSVTPSGDILGLCERIRRYWDLLDRRKEGENQANITKAETDPTDGAAVRGIVPLASHIAHNALYRYCRQGQYPTFHISDEGLSDLLALAAFAERESTGLWRLRAQRSVILLTALQSTRIGSSNAESLATDLDRLIEQLGVNKDNRSATNAWPELTWMLARHFASLPLPPDASVVDGWARVLVERLNQISRPIIEGGRERTAPKDTFLAAISQHNLPESIALRRLRTADGGGSGTQGKVYRPLSFLTPDQVEAFQAHVRNMQIEAAYALLSKNRQGLLENLLLALQDPLYTSILPPRRQLRFQRNPGDRDFFPMAAELLGSTNQVELERAVGLFEEGARITTHRFFKPIAREWSLYARAKAFNALAVVGEWEQDQAAKTASWEELWNLSSFYLQMNTPEQVVKVLAPGLEEERAPFSHLRFALYCGVTMMEKHAPVEEHAPTTLPEDIRDFLLEYLPAYPIPESNLAWVLLVRETGSPFTPIDQLKRLGSASMLIQRPVEILNPMADLRYEELIQFRSRLESLGDQREWQFLWRLWISDYAERHARYARAWQLVAATYEKARQVSRADEALGRMLSNQVTAYRHAAPDRKSTMLNQLRQNMEFMAQFYNRNSEITRERRESVFTQYYRDVPDLWKRDIAANRTLIGLTSGWLKDVLIEDTPAPPPRDGSGWEQKDWVPLWSSLAQVDGAGALKHLQSLRDRIDIALDHGFGTAALGRRSVGATRDQLKTLLAEICVLTEQQHDTIQLAQRLNQFSSQLQAVSIGVSQEPLLEPAKAIVAAMERAIKGVSQASQVQPAIRIIPDLLGAGLPTDIADTHLLVEVANDGPGDVSDVIVTPTAEAGLSIRTPGSIPVLRQGTSDVAAIGVSTNPSERDSTVTAEIQARYDWGVLQGLTTSQTIPIRWFDFQSYLRERGLGADFPNPYRTRPLNFRDDDHRLFQGRDADLDQVRRTLLVGTNVGQPFYFHGVRKVGKTSLLQRIAYEFSEAGFRPIHVVLRTVNAAEQSPETVVHLLSSEILRDAGDAGVNVQDLSAVPIDSPTSILELERFFNELAARTDPRPPVILLDEFQLLIEHSGEKILDLIRVLHESDIVWFVLSGLLFPQEIYKRCTTQLSVVGRQLNFLSYDAVKRTLREPVVDLGITIPDPVVDEVMVQTAGNPFHVANIASTYINTLNAEHRTSVSPSDVRAIASRLAKDDPLLFITSVLSPLVLNPREQELARDLAQRLKPYPDGAPVDSLLNTLDPSEHTVLQDLVDKCILELHGDNVKMRSRLLASYLESQIVQPRSVPVIPTGMPKVGVFIDLENCLSILADHGDVEGSVREFGLALGHFAEQHGSVVSRIAVADPEKISNHARKRIELGEAGFHFRAPRSTGPSRRGDQKADYALLEAIFQAVEWEQEELEPDVYIFGTGDGHFEERIRSLLDAGYRVILVAPPGSIANAYYGLQEDRRVVQLSRGNQQSDFVIADLSRLLAEYQEYRDAASGDGDSLAAEF